MKRMAIFGSTGSVGQQTLEVARHFPERLAVTALCAGANTQLIEKQIEAFRPKYFWCNSDNVSSGTSKRMEPTEIAASDEIDVVMMATSGIAGIAPTMAALKAGKTVALANKEVMVIAGQLVMEHAERFGGKVSPVDSEPSAIWQCLEGEASPPKRLIVTASGGAFRDRTPESLERVTPSEALQHPTYRMGKKITIDSATLVNKALEVVEIRWLFGIPFDRIDVVIHRESIIHSMVEFPDGSVKALMSLPDMRYPILYALTYPERVSYDAPTHWNPAKNGALTLAPMDPMLYPCFELAQEYCRREGAWPAALAGADEGAVQLFLSGNIAFTDIAGVIESTMDAHKPTGSDTLSEMMETAKWAKEFTLARRRRIGKDKN